MLMLSLTSSSIGGVEVTAPANPFSEESPHLQHQHTLRCENMDPLDSPEMLRHIANSMMLDSQQYGRKVNSSGRPLQPHLTHLITSPKSHCARESVCAGGCVLLDLTWAGPPPPPLIPWAAASMRDNRSMMDGCGCVCVVRKGASCRRSAGSDRLRVSGGESRVKDTLEVMRYGSGGWWWKKGWMSWGRVCDGDADGSFGDDGAEELGDSLEARLTVNLRYLVEKCDQAEH
jgi:hypothetical protein